MILILILIIIAIVALIVLLAGTVTLFPSLLLGAFIGMDIVIFIILVKKIFSKKNKNNKK